MLFLASDNIRLSEVRTEGTRMANLQPVEGNLPVVSEALLESTKGYIENARAENTLRAYRSDMKHFMEWAEGHGLQAMPAAPQTVSLYLSDLARQGYKPATLQRRLTAISQAHKRSNFQFDTGHALIRETLGGIKRTCGTEQDQKEALLTEDIRAMIQALPDTRLGLRDRALLLLGFAGAFRRSELVSLDVEDLKLEVQGMVVHLGHSKTDQEGEGRDIPIPYGRQAETCPVHAVQEWISAAGITSGPVFRAVDRHGNVSKRRLSDRAVANIVKRSAEAAGLDPSDYSGHSLRSGMATSAARAGATERAIMEQTGHKSTAMVRRYIRKGTLWADCAAATLGL
jgi:site-specific recombinase XerD